MIVSSPSGGIVRELFVTMAIWLLGVNNLWLLKVKELKLACNLLKNSLLYSATKISFLIFCLINQDVLINSLPDPPALIRSEDRTRSVQLTVQETSARLALLRTRLASQQRKHWL